MRQSNLYGLKRSSKISLEFDIALWKIIETNGCDMHTDKFEISEQKVFSIPMYILINHTPYFPSKYEIISEGTIIYSSTKPPYYDIKLTNNNPFYYRMKTRRNTISLNDLLAYDINGRERYPSQKTIMKESAKAHAENLIQASLLEIKQNTKIDWHWCHLIAFRMIPTEKAQNKNNLVCGTAACNGHMTNIETAVKRFIYEFKRPLGLQVDANIYVNTHFASKIAYRVHDQKGSLALHTEYFDTLTNIKTDIFDHETIYTRMKKTFGEKKAPLTNYALPL